MTSWPLGFKSWILYWDVIKNESQLKFKFSQIFLGDKNATYLCSKIISTLPWKKENKIPFNPILNLERDTLYHLYIISSDTSRVQVEMILEQR